MMELGIPLQDLAFALIALSAGFLLIAFPPQEFHSAGFTIPSVFHFLVGSEKQNFIRFQCRRTALTMVIHASLVPAYLLTLHAYGLADIFAVFPDTIIQLITQISILAALGAYSYVFYLCRNDFSKHSIIRNLKKFDRNLQRIIESINSEMRNLGNLHLHLVGYTRLIITDSWAFKVSNYTVVAIPLSSIEVQAIEAHMSPGHPVHGGAAVQFVNVVFRSAAHGLSFNVRLNSTVLADVRERLYRPIQIAEDVAIYRTISDRFVTAFTDVVRNNPTTSVPNDEDLELCLGCSSTAANVRLSKNCLDVTQEALNCDECQCRPMWCVTCLARVFAAKQDKDNTESWLSGKANCPTCRAVFCVLDVCLLE
ncbi:hypothetical protein L596_003308 [Steinernema carpocapsae]|uniref:Uncharacterized protein n=1 Tax=Steinernema carpocapsae TaxID=34508 RepID=A0A4U8US15_STECR|nr:hypothetical protein L596_003308 [Steinernema carpocapsae]